MMSLSKSNRFFDSLELRRLFAVDLICNGVRVDSYDAASGVLTCEVDVQNTGSTSPPPSGAGAGAVILSKDQVVDKTTDIRAGVIATSETPRFSQKTVTLTVHIPGSTPAGDYYVGAALDIDT